MLVGYARVSTIDQNPDYQIDALKSAGCEKIFTDHISGKSTNRNGLNEALSFLREGDTLVIWKLARLARSLKQIIEIAETLSDRGIGLKILTQNIDTDTPEGKLFFHITAAFDEFQRELIVENTHSGLKSAQERGKFGGRPSAITKEKRAQIEAMLKDADNYPYISDIIRQVKIGRTTFYRNFSPEIIHDYRG